MSLTIAQAETSEYNERALLEIKTKMLNRIPISLWEAIGCLDLHTLTVANRRQLAEMFKIDPKDISGIIRTHAHNQELNNALDALPKNEYEFVELQLKKWQTNMTFNEIFYLRTPYDIDGLMVTEDQLDILNHVERIKVSLADPKRLTFKEIFQDLKRARTLLKLEYRDHEVEDALGYWIRRRKNDIKSEVIGNIAFPTNLDAVVIKEQGRESLLAFVEAIADRDHELILTAISHWIWQVKRKAMGMPVGNHMMLILYGAQGIGKSTIVKNICSCLRDFTASTDFAQITDSRSHDIWNNLVLVIDEMGRSTTANLEDIKRRITEDSFTSRVLKTNADTQILNHATFIGTSNKDISRLIFDDTGMRRFFQINCARTIDWTKTDGIDWKLIWRSIDERAESPLTMNKDIFAQVLSFQNEARSQSSLERWFRERKHKPFNVERIKAKTLYDEFVEWEKTQGERYPTSMTKFGRDVRDIPLVIPELEINKVKNNQGWSYEITYMGSVSDSQ